ncbi:MAG TPA: ATP-binding protein [Candidatus Kapabacteria bacterium]|nr:ATP-binding protein [Candidatus Kapabacteria bacterium]
MFTTLRAKVFAGFLLILLLLVGLGGYAIYSLASLADATSGAVERSAEQSLANTSMYESLVRIDEAELRMLTGDTLDAGPVLAEEPAHFYYALQNAWTASAPQDSSSKLLNDIESRWDHYHSHLDYFYGLALHHPLVARRFYEDTLEREIDTLRARNLALQEMNFNAFQTAKITAKTRAKDSIVGVMLVAAIALAVGFVGSYIIARRTIQPLRELTDRVKELRGGHLDTRIPIHGADEIADLGFEFNRLTERLREFEAMNVSEIVREKQKSEAIIESIDDPLLLFDAGGRLLHLNRAAEELTGAHHAIALGQPLGQLFRDRRVRKDVERALEHAARTLVKPNTPLEEMLAAPPIVSIPLHGLPRHYRIRVARILTNASMPETGNEPLAGILVLFTDITHFKELDQMKSDFIAKVSHEFRTPLTSMTMSLDILGDELIGRLNAEQHDIIGASKADARRLAKLIRDLLTLSRLESVSDVSKISEEEIDVSATIEELLRSMRPMYQERGVALNANEIAEGRFRISHEHFTSVLSNLLSNALKYTPHRGIVSIATVWDASTRELTLRVSDTGIGIAIEDQQRIFEKFVQIKHRDMSTPGSVGLGLAIVREIAARYDGRVELESEVGHGSTFTVRFHLARVPEPEEVA